MLHLLQPILVVTDLLHMNVVLVVVTAVPLQSMFVLYNMTVASAATDICCD